MQLHSALISMTLTLPHVMARNVIQKQTSVFNNAAQLNADTSNVHTMTSTLQFYKIDNYSCQQKTSPR